MTNVTIRISTSTTDAPTPATGIAGAFGVVRPGMSDDTSVEVAVEGLATTGDVVVAVEGIFPVASSAFLAAVNELAGDDDKSPEESTTDPWDETLIDANVLDEATKEAAGVDERAEKKRRKAQRKRAREIIYEYGVNGDFPSVREDVKDAVRRLEAEGIIR